MSIYTERGYNDREDYLTDLAEDFGVDYDVVKQLADLYGEAEDFDGLITALEDMDTWYE